MRSLPPVAPSIARRRSSRLSALFAVLLILALLSDQKQDVPTAQAQSSQLVWSDEFNGSSVDTSNWTFEVGGHGWGNNELQYYTNGGNASVANGVLTITANRINGGYSCWYGPCQYTSTRMISKGKREFQYGRIEARIRLPMGQGTWPAFWMLGANFDSVGWPASGEIDVMEHVNNDTVTHGTMHWDSNGHVYYGGSSGYVDVTQWQVYSIEWDSSRIRWLLNGQQFWEASIENSINSTEEFHRPFFLLLNLAIGGNWPGSPDGSTQFPAQMQVDYVRVYQAGSTPPPPPPPGEGYFYLVNRNSGKCADVSGGNTGDGVTIQQWSCDGVINQQWQLVPTDGGYYRLVARHSGKCMDMSGSSTSDGGRVHQWSCHGGANQQWRFERTSDGWFRLQHRQAAGTNQYVSVAYGSPDNGAYLHQWSWLGNPDQQWRLEPVGSVSMVNKSSNKCVDVNTSQGGADGSNIHQWSCHGGSNQKWRFVHAGAGYYRVVTEYNGKVMEVRGGSQGDGANIQLWSSHGYAHAQWRLLPTGDGYLALFARHSGKPMDLNACGSGDGTNIQQWSWYNNDCQRFKLVP